VPDDEFLTVAEIADRLKLNQQTVRNWIVRGELSGVRIGTRRVRVLSSELDRYIRDSSAAQVPSEETARKTYAEAVHDVEAATEPADEAAALRRLATAATGLARVLSR
jgi:excisionase family DNA binding protein